MHLLMFFDDWLLAETHNLFRGLGRPQAHPVRGAETLGRSSIIHDDAQGVFRAWHKPLGTTEARLLHSADGTAWEASGATMSVLPRQNFPFEQGWVYDRWDADPARRYKMITWPENTAMDDYGPGRIACSADGVHWRLDPRHTWYPPQPGCGSDTNNQLFYNPFTRRWCIICRKWNSDRRVAMTESDDLVHWSEPRIILQPDVFDPPHTEIYGMAVCLYEKQYFVGLPQMYATSPMHQTAFRDNRLAMAGSIEPQLAYSRDGQYWQRTIREPFIERPPLGHYGSRCLYPTSIEVLPDGRIAVFCLGTLIDHASHKPPPGHTSCDALLLYTFRRDGFCYLEPRGGWGQLRTAPLVPRTPALSVNVEAPLGECRVQATDTFGKPLPGLTFDDCDPITGDQTDAPVRWGERDLADHLGKPIRLEVRLFDARLYALRLPCDLWYTDTQKPIPHLGAYPTTPASSTA